MNTEKIKMRPTQVEGKLHVLEIPTMEDLDNFLNNGKDPDNIRMLHYWMTQIDDYTKRIGSPPLCLWDDTVFLGAIEWQWFLEELKKNDP